MEEQTAYQKILHLFFDFPEREFGFNEIVSLTRTSKVTANKIILSLLKEDFLKRKIAGKSWLIVCNLFHEYNKTKKRTYNLEKIYNSGILDKIKQKFPGYKSIILFGSYGKGDDNEKSDIDIAVEISGNQKLKIEEFEKIKETGYRKNILATLHIFSRRDINNNLFSNIANGIILEGFLEVKK
ncbi:MAG: nucleotidyltransferase domain-containing protein [Nanoarchaeota archaeon]